MSCPSQVPTSAIRAEAAELRATPCCPRVYSAAGYSYGSTVFLGLAAAATLAYLLLGVAVGARQGGGPSLRSHPHFEHWKMIAGLVQVPLLPLSPTPPPAPSSLPPRARA